ncbi:hypothetical protein AXG93_592s1010 [Marchantia polymorpha subsp. ruderalis]|uniref:Uncharacterized protein n=1 Tax=Marchantia polymorpha subsp. ruderalis TaxID=1480154 RepID=A0A176VC14_MARPO|nr:hypothetical protein AXG93_592s1010 [Marchantia polymorpha subsp. ruderalis]
MPARRRFGPIRTLEFTLRRCAHSHARTFNLDSANFRRRCSPLAYRRRRTAEGTCGEGASFQQRRILEAKVFLTPKAKPINEGSASDEGASAEGVGAKELTAEGVPPKTNKMTRLFFPVTKALAAHASYVFSDRSPGGVCAKGASPKTPHKRTCCQRRQRPSPKQEPSAPSKALDLGLSPPTS